MSNQDDIVYNRKLSEMKGYVPFLEKTISKLEKFSGDPSKEPQLVKMKSLHNILTDPGKKLRLDTLVKCEEVLKKLHEKVEGVPLQQQQPQTSTTSSKFPRINNSNRTTATSTTTTTSKSSSERPSDIHQQKSNNLSRWPQKNKPNEEPKISSYLENMMQEQQGNAMKNPLIPPRGGPPPPPFLQQQQQQQNGNRFPFPERGQNPQQQQGNWPPRGPRPDMWGNRPPHPRMGMFENRPRHPFPPRGGPFDGGPFGPRPSHPFVQRPPFEERRGGAGLLGPGPDYDRMNNNPFHNNRFRGDPESHFNESRSNPLLRGNQHMNQPPPRFPPPPNPNQPGPGFNKDRFGSSDNFSDPRNNFPPRFDNSGPEWENNSSGADNFNSFREDNIGNQFQNPFFNDKREHHPRNNSPSFNNQNRSTQSHQDSEYHNDSRKRGNSPFNRSRWKGRSRGEFEGSRDPWNDNHEQYQQRQQVGHSRLSQEPPSQQHQNPPTERRKSRFDQVVTKSAHENGKKESNTKALALENSSRNNNKKKEEVLESPASPVPETPSSPTPDDNDTPMSPPPPPSSPPPSHQSLDILSTGGGPKVIPLEKPKSILKSSSVAKNNNKPLVLESPRSPPPTKPFTKTFTSPPASPPPAADNDSSTKPRLPKPIPTSRSVSSESRPGFSLPTPISSHPPPLSTAKTSLRLPSPRPSSSESHSSLPDLPLPPPSFHRPPHSQFQPGPRFPQQRPQQQPWRFDSSQIRQSTFRPSKKPATYGEYRKMKEEHDKKMREQQKRMDEFRKKFEQPVAEEPPPPNKEEAEKEKEETVEPPNTEAPKGNDESTLSKFKIPKKKKLSSVEDENVNHDLILKSPPRAIMSPPSSLPMLASPPSSMRKESESDSENELKIVDHEVHSESEDSSIRSSLDETSISKPLKKTSADEDEQTEGEEEEKKESQPKKDLTKEILKNIVESLEPHEASKLLRKASVLEKAEKLSLKQLKFLLADDSDSENENDVSKSSSEKDLEETAPKKKGRGRPVAPKSTKVSPTPKAKQPTTPGTRRSRRLQVSETAEDVVSSGVVENEEEEDADNSLVIDEGKPAEEEVVKQIKVEVKTEPEVQAQKVQQQQQKRGRGRPRGRRAGDNIQDDSVSSSNQNDYEDNTSHNKVEIKTEYPVELAEIDDVIALKPKPKAGRMAPKSKTWFPNRGDDTKKDKKGIFATSEEGEAEETVVVKKEPKDADLKVFLGTDEIILENQFKTKSADLDSNIRDTVKNRLEKVNGIFDKLMRDSSKDLEKKKGEEEQAKSKESLKTKFDDLGPFIVTEQTVSYSDSISSVIDKLKNKVEIADDEHKDIEEAEKDVNFLGLVRTMGCQVRAEKASSKMSCGSNKAANLDIYMRHKLLLNQSAPLLNSQLKADAIGNMFKCYNCDFSSNNAFQFISHLDAHVDNKDTKWDRCVYCNTNFASPKELASHVIAVHGSCCYQCPYCYHRSGSQIAMLVHQQSLHSGQEFGLVKCTSLQMGSDGKEPNRVPPMRCESCRYQSEDCEDFVKHMNTHDDITEHSQLVCWHCGNSFKDILLLILHATLMHTSQNVVCGIRHIDLYEKKMDKLSNSDESDLDEALFLNDSESSEEQDPEEVVDDEEDKEDDEGLEGEKLFQCGNEECQFSAQNVSDFRDHLAICEFSVDQIYLNCFHCRKQLKHVPTLLDHLKSHGPKRYSCGLCPYKSALPVTAKNHLRTVHKVPYSKLVPVDPLKTNADLHKFLVMPKNSIPKGIMITSGSKRKDTFHPNEIDSIPKVSMSRFPLRCSSCDFSTKVRNNLVKHLVLHSRVDKAKADSENETASSDSTIPPLTPINLPTKMFEIKYQKMSSLLDGDTDEEKARKPMSDQEISMMPPLIPENLRFSCCESDCQYITIDDVMLLYHIQTLHPHVDEFNCSHCPADVMVSLDDLEFHMRCHGDLLFKCGHCEYYHWQKRTAEKHVADFHPNRKQFVRNVRLEAEQKLKCPNDPKLEDVKKPVVAQIEVVYKPYKCGLCEFAEESLEGIQEHCSSVHEISQQFKCSLCDVSSNSKTDIEKHFGLKHPKSELCMIRIFFIDSSSTDSTGDERQEPLWRRDMPGLKHIRGILFEEDDHYIIPPIVSRKRPAEEAAEQEDTSNKSKVDEADNFSMECKECGIMKKTIKGLKMHIKLLHLRTGKFRCVRCQFSANILNSIHTHYKINHPDAADKPDFEERSDEAKVFTHDFWKSEWNIPTLLERKAMIIKEGGHQEEEGSVAKKFKSEIGPKKLPVGRKKKNLAFKKKKILGVDTISNVPNELQKQQQQPTIEQEKLSDSVHHPEIPLDKKTIERIMEISPFERVPTYKCQYCPKRSQDLERIERHLTTEHSDKKEQEENGYKILLRDQVVDLLTMVMDSADFICFFCDDVVGSIRVLKRHFDTSHPEESFKVKSFQGKGVSGYLECQICGHLTPGFERSKQKVHFHEEHPLESNVNASKYVLKSSQNAITKVENNSSKIDFTRFNGMSMACPKDDCLFEAKSLSAINNHLRRHTQTFKCGHCGKTHTNSSDFHRHSAMMHGDKIPDLIKDPEAEAEFDALKGLFEANLTDRVQMLKEESRKRKHPSSSNTARKSTKPVKKMPVARKSTGGGSSSHQELEPYSFYGLPKDEVDFRQISTRMSMGGMEITLNAEKMAEIIKLKPKVFVKDCKMNMTRGK